MIAITDFVNKRNIDFLGFWVSNTLKNLYQFAFFGIILNLILSYIIGFILQKLVDIKYITYSDIYINGFLDTKQTIYLAMVLSIILVFWIREREFNKIYYLKCKKGIKNGKRK